MIRAIALAFLVVVLSLGGAQRRSLADPGADYAAPGPHMVATLEGQWRDEVRHRTIPYLVRYPKDLSAPAPVVIFSHGLGGTRYAAAYYGDHLASHGYVVVFLQHPGSDSAIWNGQRMNMAVARQAAGGKQAVDRFLDVPFALTSLQALNSAPGPLQGHLDLGRIGMSGHSFGAITTQAMAGQVFAGGRSMPAPQFKAFLAMSPSSDRLGNNTKAFGDITRPFLFLTGTRDELKLGPGAGDVAADRTKPFEAMGRGPVTLLVLNGGDHMVFSGREAGQRNLPRDERFHTIVKAVSLAFWDAYLRGDDAALAWLRNGGLASYVGDDAQVRSKGPPR